VGKGFGDSKISVTNYRGDGMIVKAHILTLFELAVVVLMGWGLGLMENQVDTAIFFVGCIFANVVLIKHECRGEMK